jgi:hypothetical protein
MQFTILEEVKRYNTSPTKWGIPQTISFLRKNCKPFLQEVKYNNWPMYRGTDSGGDALMFTGIPRKKRLPTDMSRGDQHDLDGAFKKIFGWRPRSQGLFVTGSRANAGQYGPIYQIFPIGNFKFLYSTDIEDLYSEFDMGLSSYSEEIEDNLPEFISDHYTDENLVRGIKANVEISILCEKYFALRVPPVPKSIVDWDRVYKIIIDGVFKR